MAVIFSTIAADVVVAVATILIGLYLYFANAFRYWKRRGVHYVQPTSFLGNFGPIFLQREHFGEFFKRVYDNNPGQKVVGLYAGKKPLLMVRDLDVVRSVLVKDAHAFLDRSVEPSEKGDPLFSRSLFALKGSKWRHMRVKLTPTFTSGKIKGMFYLINECGKQLLPCIDQEMAKGSCVVKETVARYSTDVIASCAFGLNANALADPDCEFLTTTRKIFKRTKVQQCFAFLALFAPRLVKLLGLKIFDDSVNTYIRKVFWDVVDHREKNKVVRKDFVDILMQMKEQGQVRAEDEKELEEIKQDSKYHETKHIGSDEVIAL